MFTRFMILGQGRTGSTMLVQALNSHPDILCFGEVLNAANDYIPFDVQGYDGKDAAALSLRSADYAAFLRTLVFSDHEGIRAVGFKFHYDHFWKYAGIPDYFSQDVDLRVIHLTRQNRLRTLVSTKIAERSGAWFQYAPEPSLLSRVKPSTVAKAIRDPGRAVSALRRRFGGGQLHVPEADGARSVDVTAEELRLFCERTAYSENHWANLMTGHEIITVDYERLAADRDQVVGEIEQFLGVQALAPTVTLRRQNPEPLSDLIANYDELRAAFAGTPEEAFFDA